MIARHLLFLAARRPHSALLAVPAESVAPQAANQEPPPYIGPPQPQDHSQKTQQYHTNLSQTQSNTNQQSYQRSQQNFAQNRPYNQKANHQNYNRATAHSHDQRNYPQTGYNRKIPVDNRHNTQYYDKNHEFFERYRPNYSQNQQVYHQQMLHAENAKNYDLCSQNQGNNQQFYTLPSRRPQREIEPPRSVTPDITRGLARSGGQGRGPLSAMHMLARHGQRTTPDDRCDQPNQFGSEGQINFHEKNLEQLDAKSRLMQNHNQKQPPVDVRNRFAAPMALAAIGYRFFAASPVHGLGKNSPTKDSLKHTPISPIGPGSNNGFKSSTPSGRSTPTVAERLALTTGRNTPVQNTSGRSTPIQTTSGRNTPTHLVLSPTKSTMSNEELSTAIHKSKKRLNIKEDGENLSPSGSVTSLVQTQPGTRHSWSPESQKAPELVQTVPPPSATSRLEFKRLLLQQSVKTGPTRLSAAEQLKLSRQQQNQQQHLQQSQQNPQPTPPVKVLSPRATWRFQTPRTDVLSSTIIEDAAAEEKAMKPSPENTAPISRLNTRRQLDLCSDLPEHLNRKNYGSTSVTIAHATQPRRAEDSRPSCPNSNENNRSITNSNAQSLYSDNKLSGQHPNENSSKINVPNESQFMRDQASKLFVQNARNMSEKNSLHMPNVATSPVGQKSENLAHVASSAQNQTPLSTAEARRINNQLVRAQFLASMPGGKPNQSAGSNAYLHKQFRARSESPQHSVAQNVSRSPSAPTLETAL